MKTATLVLGAILVMLTTACGNKDSGGAVPAPVPAVVTYGSGFGTPSCAGCPPAMGFLASGMGETYYGGGPGVELALEFFGDNSILQYTSGSYGGFSMQGAYQGPFAASGRINVKVPMQQCGIPAGMYTISTVSAGSWMYESFWGGEFAAVGPTTVRIFLEANLFSKTPPARSTYDGKTFPYRIVGQMYWFGPSFMQPCMDELF